MLNIFPWNPEVYQIALQKHADFKNYTVPDFTCNRLMPLFRSLSVL